MQRLLVALLFACLATSPSLGQIHIFPALDTPNAWTGTNTFNGVTSFPGGISGGISPATPGGATLGTSLFPYSSVFVGNAAVNNIQITGTSTAPRTFTLPDANSNPVQPSACAANAFDISISGTGVIACAPAVVASSAPANQFATSISAAGVLGYSQPSFANISGTLSLAGAVFPNQGTTTTVLHGNATGNLSFGPVAPGDTTGTTGTGTVFALSASPVFTTPTLGDALATSVTATSGVPFTGLSGSSNNVQINLGRASTELNLAIPQGNGFYFTNSDLAAGDFVIRNLTAARKIYLGTGTSGASVAVTNGGINLYTATGTLPATISNDTTGGINLTPNGGPAWEIVNSGNLFSLPGKTINLEGATSGIITLQVPAIAGSNVLTFPAVTDTLVAKATTDTLTNKTIGSPIDGITCVSLCVPILVQHLTLTGQTGAIVTTTLFSTGNGTGGTPGSGVYRVTVDLFMTAVGTGGTFQPVIRWNNGAANQICSQSTVSVTSLGNTELASGNGASCTFTAAASTNITYEVSNNAVTGTPAYTLALRVEYLGT